MNPGSPQVLLSAPPAGALRHLPPGCEACELTSPTFCFGCLFQVWELIQSMWAIYNVRTPRLLAYGVKKNVKMSFPRVSDLRLLQKKNQGSTVQVLPHSPL